MDTSELKVERKPYSKPCFVLETELETRAGSPLPDGFSGPPGSDLIDPNKLFFP